MAACGFQAYLQLGLARSWNISERIPDKRQWHQEHQQFRGPYGTIEAGVRYHDLSIYAFHTSSVHTDDDKGVHEIGVKYEFKLDLSGGSR